MNETITPKKTDLGWVIYLPAEMAHDIGVAEGSLAVLHPNRPGWTSRYFLRLPPN